MKRLPMFLAFEVIDPKGLIRHGRELVTHARFVIKRPSSRRHVDRWLEQRRIALVNAKPGVCARCGCTDENCAACIARTGQPCHWLDQERTVCSACYGT